jgi:phosphoribosylamine---glycine ligase
MLTPNGPMVLEYNCRFGDPETQVLLPLLSSDLYSILVSCVEGTLEATEVRWKENSYASTVICASGGYPDSYQKGFPIEGLQKAKGDNVVVYHSGTQVVTSESAPDQVVTNGGRVLAVTGLGHTLRDAIAMSYGAIDQISFSGMQYRRDIAHRYDILNLYSYVD